MSTQPKIKIMDNSLLRKEIDVLYENTDQVSLAKWSLSLAKHVLEFAEIDFESLAEIKKAFESMSYGKTIKLLCMTYVRQESRSIA